MGPRGGSEKRSRQSVLVVAPLLVGLAAALAAQASATAPTRSLSAVAACPTAAAGSARCLAERLVPGQPSPFGLSPDQLKSAYNWPTKSTAGAGTTIAIVDAYDNPAVESDLAVFDAQYGLPPCTTANGCFTKVDHSGGNDYPSYNKNWEFEIELDVQWAHAVAPGAKILLVEAKSESLAHLLDAEDYAKAHAKYVSNSWGGNEFGTESKDDGHFVQPG